MGSDQDTSKLSYITLTDEPVISHTDLREMGRSDTGLEGQGWLDYDNDGAANYVGELGYASGAGRGCDFNYFDELQADGKAFIDSEKRELLIEMQDVWPESRHPNCGSWVNGSWGNRFFKFGDKTYYEYKTRESHRILTISSNKIVEVCKADKTLSTEVKSVGVPN